MVLATSPHVAGTRRDSRVRVLVTGATGLLGRRVLEELELDEASYALRGLCFSRRRGNVVPCDLGAEGEIAAQVEDFMPNIAIHLAAERRPDMVEARPEQARRLNLTATLALAKACHRHGVWLVYVSTDYVFDGTRPPYAVESAPNPLNEYGRQK